jgi:hypothetical protein
VGSHPITPESLGSIDEGTGDVHLHKSPIATERNQDSSLPADLIVPSAELNFELIWPDSESLFQTIMSVDVMTQHSLPVGTLPFGIPLAVDPSISIPSSSGSQLESIGDIPSGSNQRAVQDVSKMVSSIVSWNCPFSMARLFLHKFSLPV